MRKDESETHEFPTSEHETYLVFTKFLRDVIRSQILVFDWKVFLMKHCEDVLLTFPIIARFKTERCSVVELKVLVSMSDLVAWEKSKRTQSTILLNSHNFSRTICTRSNQLAHPDFVYFISLFSTLLRNCVENILLGVQYFFCKFLYSLKATAHETIHQRQSYTTLVFYISVSKYVWDL